MKTYLDCALHVAPLGTPLPQYGQLENAEGWTALGVVRQEDVEE